jgi:hypothetical protein
MERRIFIHTKNYDIPMVEVYPDQGTAPFPAVMW